jgi:hypothetical protein
MASSTSFVSTSFAPNEPAFTPTSTSMEVNRRIKTRLRAPWRFGLQVAKKSGGGAPGEDFNRLLHILNNVDSQGVDVKRSYLARLWNQGVNFYVVTVLFDLRNGLLTFGDALAKIRRRALLEQVVHVKTTKRDHASFLHLHMVCQEFMPANWSFFTAVTDESESDATDLEDNN